MGVLDIELDGNDDVPCIAVEDDGLIDDDDVGLFVEDGELVDDDDVVDVVVDGIEGAGIVELVSVLGIAGGSVLLQALNAAIVPTRTTHLIELRMIIPRFMDNTPRVLACLKAQRR